MRWPTTKQTKKLAIPNYLATDYSLATKIIETSMHNSLIEILLAISLISLAVATNSLMLGKIYSHLAVIEQRLQ
jgi:hypothetical protein